MYAKRSKSRETLCFGNVLRPREGQKSGFAKTAGAEPSGGMRDQNPDVARNTFRSQNVQNISKSKCSKHFSFGPLLEVVRLAVVQSAFGT